MLAYGMQLARRRVSFERFPREADIENCVALVALPV